MCTRNYTPTTAIIILRASYKNLFIHKYACILLPFFTRYKIRQNYTVKRISNEVLLYRKTAVVVEKILNNA